MEIGQQIKAVRLKLHMSQTDIASLFCVSFATVNRGKNGKTTPWRFLKKTSAQKSPSSKWAQKFRLQDIFISTSNPKEAKI